MSFLIPAFLAVFAIIVIVTVGTIIRTGIIIVRHLFITAPKQGKAVQQQSIFWATFIGALVTSISGTLVFYVIPKLADYATNGFPPVKPDLRGAPKSIISYEKALEIHNSFPFVADLHADTFLWPHRGSILESTLPFGYVDVPRMIEGNVGLQTFATVTQVPAMQNFDFNSNITDIAGLLHFAQQYPSNSWLSSYYRSIAQGQRLQQTADDSNGKLIFVKTKKDLELLIEQRKNGKKVVGGLFSIEGAQSFEGDVSKVDGLFNVGVRMFGVSHFVDTLFGGSAHGVEKYGITEFGKKSLRRAVELNMIIDLAHSSRNLFFDIVNIIKEYRKEIEESKNPTFNKPILIVSHTGVKGMVDSPRNLDDTQLKAIADVDGVVGVTFFKDAIGDVSVPTIIKTIKYVVDVIGADHVALGSDFDGSVRCGIDSRHFSHLTHQLLEAGFNAIDAEKIMGGNVRRVFEKMLPLN